ncbi:MAG TPA: hypothetical protein VJ867_12610 [Gemmatimonadaceae bacterium]|nr:hypothetical protein [Gemmatimonadaceae bacterium]
MRHTIVPSADRADFQKRARRLNAHYGARGCHYWLFEESSLPGAYVEFFEATDAAALQRAHHGAPGAPDPASRTYTEIPLT